MTQEEKEILLKDLLARLPYNVKCAIKNSEGYHHENVAKIGETTIDKLKGFDGKYFNIYHDNPLDWDWYVSEVNVEDINPYLFPLSSMNEEQEKELITITNGKFRYMWGDINNAIPRKNTSEWGISENAFINGIKVINILYIWLLKNHFDINGLIPMGLAIDATGLNIY